MEEQYKKRSTTNSEFVSQTVRQSRARLFSEEQIQHAAKDRKKSSLWDGWENIRKKADAVPSSYKKLLRNTVVCAILAFGLWGIKSVDSTLTNSISDGVKDATASEMQMDEDMGRLKFVNGEIVEDPTEVSADTKSTYSLPLEGEVVQSFSESQKDVQIKSEENAKVMAILSGTVIKTTGEAVVIENDNGTQTTYQGLIPTVKAGDAVENSDQIGKLAGEVLCLETVSGIGYVDSLNSSEINQTVMDG